MPDELEIEVPIFNLNIPDNAAGLVKGAPATPPATGGDDPTPEELAARADEAIKAKEKADKEKAEKDKTTNTEKVTELTKKAEENIDSLTDEEKEILIKAGVLKEEDTEEISKKLEELSKKKPEELTDEEKKFIEENKVDEEVLINDVKKQIAEELGIEIKKEYTNDVKGFHELAEDIATVKLANKLSTLLETNKDFAKVYNHFVVEKRGLNTFLKSNSEPDFKAFKIREANSSNPEENIKAVEDQKKILDLDLTSKGLEPDERKKLIEDYEDTGKLFTKAKDAYTRMDANDKAAKAQELEAEKKRIDDENRDIEENWKKVRETISKNNFNGFAIPEAKLAAFKDAILNPINEEGLTKMDVIRSKKMTLETQLLFDYMLMNDMKDLSLLTAKENKAASFAKGKESNKNRKLVFSKQASSTTKQNSGRIENVSDFFNKLDYNSIQTK